MTRALGRELDRELAGVELRAFRLDGAERDLFLLFGDRTLAWRLHPTRGQILMRPPTDPGPSDLRHAARVRRVVTPPDERLVRIELLPKRGGPPRDVVIELLGNQWNAAVVEAGSGVVRHVLWSRRGGRGLTVGGTYALPEGQSRAGADGTLSLERWLSLLSGESPEHRARTLVRNVAWTSPLNAPALLGEDLDAPDRTRLVTGHGRWVELVTGAPRPVSLALEDGPQPYPVPLPGIRSEEAPTLLDAFDLTGSATGGAADEPSLLDPELVRRLEDAAGKARRRVVQLEHELETLDDASALRSLGDLILARYAEVPRGTERAVLTGFDGEEASVALDPELEPHENAARYYDRATRIERAHTRLPRLIEGAQASADALDLLLARARAGEMTAQEVRDVLPTPAPEHGGQPDGDTVLPYRTFRSSGGLEIRVGRGAKHNDDLTFRHSSPGDVWLHARHAAGAHVILRWNGPGNPPARDLAEAATLAALHSKARTSGSVPVDWTLRKYVRKPRGAPRGAVVPDRVSTLFVRPDPELERSLSDA